MSLVRITKDDVETFTIVANPKKTFVSSSFEGVTGTVNLFARRSDIEKEPVQLSRFLDSQFDEKTIESARSKISQAALVTSDLQNEVSEYLSLVNQQSISAKKQKQLNIFRFEPTLTFSDETLKKRVVQNLMSYYRPDYPSAHWGYTNYHTLNCFTSDTVPTGSVLLYPNSSSLANSSTTSGSYAIPGAFTFEFYINPRYQNSPGTDFHDGTIFHLSSSYAISLMSGSSRDSQGRVNGFRIKLQLSHSADIVPSSASVGNYPNDLIFLSKDNSLKYNHWHHVAIRWGTNQINDGTGSFFIDGLEQASFNIPSSTISPQPYGLPQSNPDALCIGNFYEGTNQGSESQSVFFSSTSATRDGLVNLAPGFNIDMPANVSFAHPLNAEVHDLRIYKSFRLSENIVNDTTSGPSSLDELVFYMGPFFTRESPLRTTVGENGGVLQTPFFAIDSATDDPFNVALSFGVGGHYLNLENFLRDFATKNYPRQIELTGSQITTNAEPKTANEFLYDTGSIRKRNLTILPCDNGLFVPNFDLLKSGTFSYKPDNGTPMDHFVNDLGHLDLTMIKLRDLVTTASLRPGLVYQSGSIFEGIAGATPEDPGVDPGEVLTVYQRTRDSSSNEVTFFEISNIFFGNRIKPGSFKVTDSKLTGSGEKVSMTLMDDGYGNIYRADSLTEHATWNSVGNIFYNEGMIVVKSPNIPFFGKEQFSMEFEGEQTIHVLMLSAEAGVGLVNSSSNPDFLPVSATLNANDPNKEFVYITNIDWLDDNLNVIMKTNLSQPLKKRTNDKLLLKAKMDF